jgi:hypothetical protein
MYCQLKCDTETIILGDFNICMKNNNNSLNGVTISRTPMNNFLKQFQFSFTGFVSLHFVQSILFNSSTKLAVLYFFKHLIY